MFKSSPAKNCCNSCTVDGISIHLHLRKREPQQQQHRSMASEEYYPKILHLQGSLGLWIAEVRHPSNRYLLHEQSIDEILFERNLADSNSSIRGFVRMICFVGSMYCGIVDGDGMCKKSKLASNDRHASIQFVCPTSEFVKKTVGTGVRDQRAIGISKIDLTEYSTQYKQRGGRCLYEITTRISRSLRVLKTANMHKRKSFRRSKIQWSATCVSFDLLFWSFFPRVSDRLCLSCPLKQWMTPL